MLIQWCKNTYNCFRIKVLLLTEKLLKVKWKVLLKSTKVIVKQCFLNYLTKNTFYQLLHRFSKKEF